MKASELPEGWEWKRLGDIGKIFSGSTPSTSNPEYFDGEIPWITPSDLSNFDGIYIERGKKNITEIGLKSSSAQLLPKDTILFSSRAPIGYVAIAANPVTTNQGFKNLVLKEGIDPKYVFYYLKTHKREMQQFGSGSTFLEVSAARFAKIPIIIPPLPVQGQIVAVLDLVDVLRRQRQDADALMGALLQSLFLGWFGDPVSNPKGWDTKKLGDLCTIRRGASPRPIADYLGGTVPWIKIGDGTKGNEIFIYKTSEKIIEAGVKKSVFLKKGSLIFANCGVSLGFSRILNIEGCIHDGWLSLEDIDPSLNKIYLLKLINGISQHFRNIAPDGTQPNLNTGIMKNFLIPLPPLALQQQFARVVQDVERIRERQVASGKEIEGLCEGLMQRAFTGELAT